MARHRVNRRYAFTLVELLVVISIIGLLVGLLIPAIQRAKALAQITACQNNMKNVAIAAFNYESRNREYPGYLNVLTLNNGQTYSDPDTGQKKGVSFIIPLLSDLDRPDLDRAWRTPVSKNQQNFADPRVFMDITTCVSDPQTTKGGTPLSYVANAGMADSQGSSTMPRDWADNGVFFDRYTGDRRTSPNNQGGGAQAGGANAQSMPLIVMSSDYISRGDGLTQTLLISENVDAGNYTDNTEAKLGFVWNGSGNVNLGSSPPNLNPPDDNMRINRGVGNSDLAPADSQHPAAPTTFARPSSWHPGGVNVYFCDGHARFLNQDIDYYVYCLLMSPNGKRVRTPGTNTPLPNFDRPLDESWYK